MDQTFTALRDAARAEHGVLGATWLILADWLEEQGDARCYALRGLHAVSAQLERLETRGWQPGALPAKWSVGQIRSAVFVHCGQPRHYAEVQRCVLCAVRAEDIYGWLIWRWLPLRLPCRGGTHAERLWQHLKPTFRGWLWDTFLTRLGLGVLPYSYSPSEISRTTSQTYLREQTRTRYLAAAGVARVQDLGGWAPHYRNVQRCQDWWLGQTTAPDRLLAIVHALQSGGLFASTETPLYVA